MPVLDSSVMFGDCSETAEDMTVDSRDSKDPLNSNDLTDDQSHPNDSPRSQHHTNTVDMASDSRHEALSDCSREDVAAATEEEDDLLVADDKVAEAAGSSPTTQRTPTPTEERVDEPSAEEEHGRDACSPPTRASPPQLKTEPFGSPKACRSGDDERASVSPTAVSPSNTMPRLRLNALLASDPALKPDAKDLKALHEESQAQQSRLAAQQKHQDEIEALAGASGEQKATPPAAPVDMPRIKVFMCMPCGIGFSSPSTLEAHQAYYCSHRNKDADEENASLPSADKAASSSAAGTPPGNASNAAAGGSGGEPAAKAIKTGKQYACTQCSYSADKKVSLNRHMRMHQTSPAASITSATNGGMPGSGSGIGAGAVAAALDDSSSQQIDRYCSDCDIRFNNVKTYRAHKMHYCSSRRNDGQLTPKLEVSTAAAAKNATAGSGVVVGPGGISPQARTKTPTPAMVAAAAAAAVASLQQTPTQPFLALPTNPILIIPYSLIRAASIIPGPLNAATPGVTNPDATCFTLTNGSLKPLATSLNLNSINAGPAAGPLPINQLQLGESPRPQQMPHMLPNDSMLTEKNASRNPEATETGAPQAPKRKEGATRESAPLDLSLRRSPIAAILHRHQRLRSASAAGLDAGDHMDSLLEGKENMSLDESGSMTPEHIVCAPSLPNSPSMSPSPKRRAISPRSSGAGSTSSMSPPAPNVTTASLAAAATNMLDNLPLRSMLHADLAMQLSDSSNLMNPLLAKKNLELMLKLSAAAAAAVNSSAAGGAVPQSTTPTPAELAAAAVAAATAKPGLLSLPGVLPGAPPTGGAAAAAGPPVSQPQIYVKQGVSKCKECNIVFCKYENYLAHKQHYCSARNQDASGAGGDTEPKVCVTPPMVAGASPAETTPVAYQQLICAACGIKYTSLDNLRAHQNYYCPKGGGALAAAAAAAAAAATAEHVAMAKEKCGKCKTVHEVGGVCAAPAQPPPMQQSPSSGAGGGSHQNVNKCPVCDAVSMTATESRKHMETHGTVKAFRCSICRYKGNTLRGMRTHIRMHFDKKSCDFNEEHYMSCILEDEGIEIPSAATVQQQQQLQQAAAVVATLQSQQQQQQQQQIFNCDLCNYSSSYKGNVLRHMKSVHPHVPINSPSISPEVADLDVSDAASMSSSLNGDAGPPHSSTIKTEPLEPISNSSSSFAALNNAAAAAAMHDNNSSPALATTPHHPNSNDHQLMAHHIKSEPLDAIEARSSPLLPPPPLTSRRPGMLSSATPPPPLQTAAAPPPPPPLNHSTAGDENSLSPAALNAKYCQTCDISFNYTKTFLAHKQFYCKNKIRLPEASRNEDNSSPNAAVGNLMLAAMPGSPSAPMLLQKNKENLQQEAAI